MQFYIIVLWAHSVRWCSDIYHTFVHSLTSMIFYNRNLLFAECNYEIYDKKFLIIVRCLKYWRFDLKTTEIFIKIFTDHKNLKYFMISKELTRRQARCTEKLSEYNFKIMYQSEIKNAKIDVFIYKVDDCKVIMRQLPASAFSTRTWNVLDLTR